MRLRTICEVDAPIDRSFDDSENRVNLNAIENSKDMEKELDQDIPDDAEDEFQQQQDIEAELKNQQRQETSPLVDKLDKIDQDLSRMHSQYKRNQRVSDLNSGMDEIQSMLQDLAKEVI